MCDRTRQTADFAIRIFYLGRFYYFSWHDGEICAATPHIGAAGRFSAVDAAVAT